VEPAARAGFLVVLRGAAERPLLGAVRDASIPDQSPFPLRDPAAGIVFRKGGARGVYQAGVVHGFVLSGYFPETIAGTSVGSLSGAVLALAAEIEDQRRRMSLLSEFLDAWLKNPGADVLDALRRGPLADLLGDLCDVDLTLGELATLFRRLLAPGSRRLTQGAALARMVWALPLSRPRVGAALRGALAALFSGTDVGLGIAQAVLDAYGMERSLLDFSAIDRHFGAVLARYAPRGQESRFDDLTRSDLLVPVANLSRFGGEKSRRRILTFAKPLPGERGSRQGPRLLATLRASSAFGPFFPGVRLREVTDQAPPGTALDDVLADAAIVEADGLAPVVDRWTERGERRTYCLFAIYQSPLDGDPHEDAPGSPFFGAALRSLELLDEADMPFAAQVVEMVTEMVEALHRAGRAVPRGVHGRVLLPIHTVAVAPRHMLPVATMSAPEPDELRRAAAMGCRAALEALHASTLRALCHDRPSVPCAELLEVARARRSPAPDANAYYQPLPILCGACTRALSPPPRTPADPRTPEISEVNDFAPFHEDQRLQAGQPLTLTIVVPAGGVFLGLFQFGAIAALDQYQIKPDLYAGASVGTLFSYLFQASLGGGSLVPIVDLARTVPRWVDAVLDERGIPEPDRRGVFDQITDALVTRWSSGEAAGLRALHPREIVDVLAAERLDPRGQATWETFQRGLDAILFQPIADRRSGRSRTLGPAFRLHPGDRDALREVLSNIVRGRLPAALSPAGDEPPLLDRIAANLDLYDPGPPVKEGDVIGFDGLEHYLRAIAFGGIRDPGPTLSAYSTQKQVRFVFTVTNHTAGTLEYFGFDDGRSQVRPAPLAIQAAAASSAFPLAFRRRTREEIVGEPVDHPRTRYADGGILNNFPSDTAFAYLHRLTGRPETRWIGAAAHQVLLLSITGSDTLPGGSRDDDRLLFVTLKGQWLSEVEKVDRTLRMQQQINALAPHANPVLRAAGQRQAIVAEMSLISPTYPVYSSLFAFKEWLGFTVPKQLELIASGCRRTRLTLEWGKYQDRARDSGKWHLPTLDALRRAFVAEVAAEFSRRLPDDACIFGRFNPEGPAPIVCPFALEASTRDVFVQCRNTAHKELAPEDLKLWRRLYPTTG
jgi:predicted acylesterase/phospholipase RssA